tara:strand:- start:417 stop:1010 length:594 start_codon:yes stop_codon:yes gene_type:complete
MDQTLIKKYFNARTTILEMFSDRGVTVPPNLNVSYEEFTIMFSKNELSMVIQDTETYYIYFHKGVKNFSKKDLTTLTAKIFTDLSPDTHLTIVSTNKVNKTLMREIKTLPTSEVFILNELYFNITKHELIPEMRLLKKEEINTLMDKFEKGFSAKQFKKILVLDPISKYYGAKREDVFEIKRINTSVGLQLDYRYVK